MRTTENGISLIEILVALTILSIGLLALAGASATVTRMIGEGRWNTVVMALAQRRVDLLRMVGRDSAGCGLLVGGTAALPGGLTERWSITPGLGSVGVEVVITGRQSRVDTLSTVIQCQ